MGARETGGREVAIRTENLVRTFGSIRALDGVTLDVPAGIVFGMLGPNGAGKTTMIRVLLGLIEPTAGWASALGHDVRTDSSHIRERTGALLEHTGLYERLTAQENLEFYARVWRMPAEQRRDRIRELLGAMGLWARRDDRVRGWSRGMKQKLAIARALLHRPRLMFLDEPTAGLDPRAAFELRAELAGLVEREGVTVFLTTHNLAEAEELCSVIAVIRSGRLVAVGSPAELRRTAGGTRVEIVGHGFTTGVVEALRTRTDVTRIAARDGRLIVDLADDATVGPLVAQLVAGGATVEEAVRPRASLEEVFLTLTGAEA